MRPAALAVVALSLAACSAVLSPDGHPIHCMGTGPDDTCIPFGMICVDGLCVVGDGGVGNPDACVPSPELCDGRDNDCNGVIDDGADADGDGYTFCGGGMRALVDCNDMDPTVHPGAPEVCDGKDNDCNNMIDEVPGICPGTQECVMSLGACHEPDCTVREHMCGTGMICDTALSPPSCVSGSDCRMNPAICTGAAHCNTLTGACVTSMPIGSSCTVDEDCTSTLCIDTAVLGLSSSGRVCGAACCVDAQCPMGTVCWAPGNGARSCLPPSLVGRATPGPGASGTSCGADSDCRSGLCGTSHDGCVGSCGNTGDCSGALVCSLTEPVAVPTSTSYTTFSCVSATSSSAHDLGATCCGDGECKSGICLGWMDTWLGCVPGNCSAGCRTNDDCGSGCGPLRCQGYCGYVNFILSGGASAVEQTCLYRSPGSSGSAPSGGGCTTGADCRSNFCDSGVCHDTCCSDTDCQASGQRCRPGTGTYPTMRCR